MTAHSIAIERLPLTLPVRKGHHPLNYRATIFNIDPATGYKSVSNIADSPTADGAVRLALRYVNATQFRVEKLSGVSLPELKKWFEDWGLTLDVSQPMPPTLPPPTKNEESPRLTDDEIATLLQLAETSPNDTPLARIECNAECGPENCTCSWIMSLCDEVATNRANKSKVGEMPPFVKLSTEDQENVVMFLSNDFGFSFDTLLEAYCEKLHADEINDIVEIVKEKNLS